MAYNKFTIEKLQDEFGIKIRTVESLFTDKIVPLKASSLLQETLKENVPLALAVNTEKARSEFVVAPLLVELRRQLKTISLFSGTELNVDKLRGLNGHCDFIISLDEEQFLLTAPLITLVEAKKDNVTNGIPQCIAEMIGVQLFNQQKNKKIERIYGVITTGSNWKFLSLEGQTVHIQSGEFYIDDVESILGILAKMIETK